MYVYLTIENLKRASLLSAVVTVMSIPRLVEGGMHLEVFVPAAMLSMILAGGAATAWGDQGGLPGLFPEWARLWRGMAMACLFGGLLLLVAIRWIDPVVRPAMESAGPVSWVRLRYPTTVYGKWALVLWSAGFETVFFQGAAMSFLARLTKRPSPAVIGATVLRTLVAIRQLEAVDIGDPAGLIVVATATGAFAACFVFSWGGLPSAMLFSAIVSLHVFAGG